MSVLDILVIRQCLSLLPLQNFVAPFLDYRKQKLSTLHLLKIFLVAQVLRCQSLSYIERLIRSDTALQHEFQLTNISKSQLSRRINDLPEEIPCALFQAVIQRIQQKTRPATDRKHAQESLALVDSTNIRLPLHLADWARVTKQRSGVKIHTRVRIVGKHDPYPDRIFPSTGNVSDYEGSDFLVNDPYLLYVMDRGYVCYKRMEQWVIDELQFVIRIHTHHHATVLKERPIPAADAAWLQRDATVRLGNNANTSMTQTVRLIEFHDEQGRLYRLATTCWKRSAKDIANIYRQRWLVELFFKWVKQHLKVARLYSHQPQAVWNHIFLALTAYGLAYLVKLETQTTKSLWNLLELLDIYAFKRWSELEAELNRVPCRNSKGRQKTVGPPQKQKAVASEVILVKPSKRKQ